MSKVIPNHVVRVGQTICVSSPEEHACLHADGCLSSCRALPSQYFYYSMEGWDRQSSLVQTKECPLPKMELYGSSKPNTEITSMILPNLGDQSLRDNPMEARHETTPVPLALDISIEHLNQLILEIDPTFKPLQPSYTAAVAKTHATDSPDIKYIEMSPTTRAKCYESWQSSASSSIAPLSVSPPNHGHLLPLEEINGDNYDASDHAAVLCGNDPGGPLSTGRHSPTFIQVSSNSISIPQRNQKNFATCGSNSRLATSLGSEKSLKPSQYGKTQQRCSETSIFSTSPGSDTSYILRSSSQSLPTKESDIPATRSTGSPLSAGSFSGSYVSSCHSDASCPSINYSQKRNCSVSPPCPKGQASNGSPLPTANPTLSVPLVLINGCLEHSDLSPNLSRVQQGSFKPPSASGNRSKTTTSESSLSSSSSLESCCKDTQPSMKFVMDTSKHWFKPSLTRDQAVQLLVNEPPGTFIMRDSTSYCGSFGLAMKIGSSKTGEDGGDIIRHFLIESSSKGVHLKGANEEPYFGSLSAFVYQHSIMSLSLPCKLVIPSKDFTGGEENTVMCSESTFRVSKGSAVCNLLYLHSVTMETLTGIAAVRKAVSSTFELETLPIPTVVHFKATEQGITLTDVQRKIFFRRHYPLATVSFCDMDPENRKWQKFSKTSRIFGFVAKSPAESENICHLFSEYDAVHPASHIIDFIKKLLPAA